MKYRFPPEFEKLTREQIDQVNAWLDEFPYRIVHQKLQEHFGIKITNNKLCRYTQNLELAEDLSDENNEFEAKAVYALLNGEPVPYEEATLHLISKHTFYHTLRREISVNRLVALHRLATYKQRLDLDQRRVALNERRSGLSTRENSQPRDASHRRAPNPRLNHPVTPKPSLPPLSQHEWQELLSHPPSDYSRTPTEKYSPPRSAAEELLAREAVLFRQPCSDLATP